MKKQLFFGGILKILIPGFVPISIAVYYQLKAPLFTTSGEILGVVFGVFCFFTNFIFLPGAFIMVIMVSKDTLRDPVFKQRWGVIYQDFKMESRW